MIARTVTKLGCGGEAKDHPDSRGKRSGLLAKGHVRRARPPNRCGGERGGRCEPRCRRRGRGADVNRRDVPRRTLNIAEAGQPRRLLDA